MVELGNQSRRRSFRMAVALSAVMLAASGYAQLGEPVDVAFTAAVDGTAQRYVRMLPKGFDSAPPHDVLIALHGHGADRWQYVQDARGECRAARDFAGTNNMIYVSPDYRAATSWMGPKAEADVVQIIASLRKDYRVRKVFLTGASMGGTSVLIFAALHPDLVAGVSSINGMANMVDYAGFQDAIAASYGGDKQQVPEEYRKRSAELQAGKFTMPVAFAVGGKDTIVPPDSVRRLAARLQKTAARRILLIDREDTGHETSYEDSLRTLDFITKE